MSEEESLAVPEKLNTFMYALMKEAQRWSFMDFCGAWGIDYETDYAEIVSWFKEFGIEL